MPFQEYLNPHRLTHIVTTSCWHRLKINAIPHYIVCAGPNSRTKYSLNGAHQTSDLLGAMERVAKEELQAAGRDAAAVARAAGGQPAYGAALLKAAAGKPAGSNALFC